jgi:alkylhydroperoxidase/carboxymuconolactone decarboxylase family protein
MSETYYDPKDLPKFENVADFQPKLAKKFFSYYGEVFREGALTQREKSLIALAVAHAIQCPYCIEAYTESSLEKLAGAFNPMAAEGVMCRTLLSVGWDGYLYDCDFNQMLELRLSGEVPKHIRDFDVRRIKERDIIFNQHCFGCTAGAGSSCGGETA